MNKLKKHLPSIIRFVVILGISVGTFFTIHWLTTIAAGDKDKFALYSDAAFINLLLFAGAGVLVLSNNEGVYDSLGFTVHVMNPFTYIGKNKDESVTYKKYKEEKKSKPKKRFMVFFIVAALYAVVAFVFYLLV